MDCRRAAQEKNVPLSTHLVPMPDWRSPEAALHSVSALGKSVKFATTSTETHDPAAAQSIDKTVARILICLGVDTLHDRSGGGVVCEAHPALLASSTLVIGALSKWLEARCVGGTSSAGAGSAAEDVLLSLRRVCFTSLRHSDHHHLYPLRTHDELHAGVMALLKVSSAGSACQAALSSAAWFSDLWNFYRRLQTQRWRRLFPGTEPPGTFVSSAEATALTHDLPEAGCSSLDALPLSSGSRRALLAVLFVLGTSSASCVETGLGDDSGSGPFPFLAMVLEPICGAISHGAAVAGLPEADGNAVTGAESAEERTGCDAGGILLASGSSQAVAQQAVAVGLRIMLDALADLECGRSIIKSLSDSFVPCKAQRSLLLLIISCHFLA